MTSDTLVRPRVRALRAASVALAAVLGAAFGAGCDPTYGQTGVILKIHSDTPIDCVDLVARKPDGEPVTKTLTLPAQAHDEFRTFVFRALIYSGGPLGNGAVELTASAHRQDENGKCLPAEVAAGAAAFNFVRGTTPEVDLPLAMKGVDSDSDGFADQDDCAPNDPSIYPRPGPEKQSECDGFDNNCSGDVDEGCPCNATGRSCYPLGLNDPRAGVGACRLGTQACNGGILGKCQGAVLPASETCDGIDTDCDGTPDPASCPCTEGATRPCYDAGPARVAGVGACAMGQQTCRGGEFGPCVGAVPPTVESCNGQDDDCNGTIDDPATVNTPACGNQQGACALSRRACGSGEAASCGSDEYQANAKRLGVKWANVEDTSECDGVDNDCDGQIDEGCSCAPGAKEACHPLGATNPRAAQGACRLGTRLCSPNGTWGACEGFVAPVPETCNGQDDDCDGLVDNDIPGLGASCDTGRPGTCRQGEQRCDKGVLRCVARTAPSDEVCDGQDNDCNGTVDEGFDKANDPAHCGGPNDCRACATGNLCCNGHCADTQTDALHCGGCGVACAAGQGCCGGGCTDLMNDPAHCGRCDQACASGQACRQGSCVAPTETACGNGQDDDLDGLTDCADPDCPAETSCGTGKVCRRGSCVPQGESRCDDGLDDDADGLVDCADSDCPAGVRCGTQSGYTKWCRAGRCVLGVELDCADGVDDDGDGLVDCADSDCATGASCDAKGGVCFHSACSHETNCANHADDDGDGKIDCKDPDCGPGLACDDHGGSCQAGACVHETTAQCGDGQDNDGDGLTDCADSDCPAGTACQGGGTCCTSGGAKVCARETNCGDGVDNDCDGKVDCNDPDCPGCAGGTVCCNGACRNLANDPANCNGCGVSCDDGNPCTADTCSGTGCGHQKVPDRTALAGCEGASLCCNGQCAGAHETASQCSDGKDNDCDGLVDCNDPDCPCATGTQCCAGGCVDLAHSIAHCGACGAACPAPAECKVAVCQNGACGTTNAADGTACTSIAGGKCHAGACAPPVELASSTCADGLDNDFDGLVDCQDPDCTAVSAGLTFCAQAGRCVRLASDLANCGSCGKSCKAGEICTNGQCLRETTGDSFPFASTCGDGKDNDGDGKTDCGDPDCGDGSQCGVTNGEPRRCCGGACAIEQCGNGQDDDCDGMSDCADPDCNGQLCTGTAGAGAVCQGGSCVCNATTCPNGCCNGSTCVPWVSETDAKCGTAGAACGACGGSTSACNKANGTCVQCTANGYCSGATPTCDLVGGSPTQFTCTAHCGTSGAAACGNGTTCCSGGCTDLTSDAANCGVCGATCNAGQVCSAGKCTCAADSDCLANQFCAIVSGQPSGVCTACGSANPGNNGHTCQAGSLSSPASGICCGGTCGSTGGCCDAPTGTRKANNNNSICGSGLQLCADCPDTATCSAGSCGLCSKDSDCVTGRSCDEGVCCPAGQLGYIDPSAGPTCVSVCPSGTRRCGAACIGQTQACPADTLCSAPTQTYKAGYYCADGLFCPTGMWNDPQATSASGPGASAGACVADCNAATAGARPKLCGDSCTASATACPACSDCTLGSDTCTDKGCAMTGNCAQLDHLNGVCCPPGYYVDSLTGGCVASCGGTDSELFGEACVDPTNSAIGAEFVCNSAVEASPPMQNCPSLKNGSANCTADTCCPPGTDRCAGNGCTVTCGSCSGSPYTCAANNSCYANCSTSAYTGNSGCGGFPASCPAGNKCVAACGGTSCSGYPINCSGICQAGSTCSACSGKPYLCNGTSSCSTDCSDCSGKGLMCPATNQCVSSCSGCTGYTEACGNTCVASCSTCTGKPYGCSNVCGADCSSCAGAGKACPAGKNNLNPNLCVFACVANCNGVTDNNGDGICND